MKTVSRQMESLRQEMLAQQAQINEQDRDIEALQADSAYWAGRGSELAQENARLREDCKHQTALHEMFREHFCHAVNRTPQPTDSMIAAYQAYMDAHLVQVQEQQVQPMQLQVLQEEGV